MQACFPKNFWSLNLEESIMNSLKQSLIFYPLTALFCLMLFACDQKRKSQRMSADNDKEARATLDPFRNDAPVIIADKL